MERRWKLQVHLSAGEVRPSPDILVASLAAEARRLESACGPGFFYRVAVRLTPDPSATIRIGREATADYCAMLEVASLQGNAPPPSVSTANAAVQEFARRQVELGLRVGTVLVGTEHVIIPREQPPLVMLYCLRRLASLSVAEFQHYWLNHHAPVALAVPNLHSYRQFHVSVAESARLSQELGADEVPLDGVAEVYFPDLAAYEATMSSDAVSVAAYQDERRFIDHKRSHLGLFRFIATGAGQH